MSERFQPCPPLLAIFRLKDPVTGQDEETTAIIVAKNVESYAVIFPVKAWKNLYQSRVGKEIVRVARNSHENPFSMGASYVQASLNKELLVDSCEDESVADVLKQIEKDDEQHRKTMERLHGDIEAGWSKSKEK